MSFPESSRLSRLDVTPESRYSFLLASRYRLLVPLLIVLCVKLVSSFFLYNVLGIGSNDTYWMTVNWDTEGQNANLRTVAQQGMRWPYLFLGWDSAWYLSIVMKGYAFSSKSFAFFPGYPVSSWLLDTILHAPVYSIIALSFIPGILSVPAYQLFVESFFDKSKAFRLALLYAFFPYVFVFTTVAYGEGLFLLLTMISWYFLKKRRIALTSLFASFSTIVRAAGAVMFFPMVLEMHNEHKNRRRFFYASYLFPAFPFLAYFSWLVYSRLTFNSWLPTGWSGMYSFRTLVFELIPQKGVQALVECFQTWQLSPLFIVFVAITPFLLFALFRMDKALCLYSAAYFLGVLYAGALASIPRFLSFLFPIWLPLTFRIVQSKISNLLTIAVCTAFIITGLYLWVLFINGTFIA